MALIVNGVTIPEVSGRIKIGNVNVQKVVAVKGSTSVTVWEVPQIVTVQWETNSRTDCIYSPNPQSGEGIIEPTSGGNYNLGSSSGKNAWMWRFTTFPDIAGKTLVPGSARLRFYRRDSNGATTAGSNSFLRAGEAFNRSGLSVVYSSASDARFPISIPDGAGDITLTLPDGLMNQFINGEKTIGGAIAYVNALGTISADHPVVLSAQFE